MEIYIAAIVTIALIHQIISARRTMNSFDQILAAIDTETTAVGDRVAALVSSMNPTPAQQATADAIVSRLKAIAADKENPVPEPVETTI